MLTLCQVLNALLTSAPLPNSMRHLPGTLHLAEAEAEHGSAACIAMEEMLALCGTEASLTAFCLASKPQALPRVSRFLRSFLLCTAEHLVTETWLMGWFVWQFTRNSLCDKPAPLVLWISGFLLLPSPRYQFPFRLKHHGRYLNRLLAF